MTTRSRWAAGALALVALVGACSTGDGSSTTPARRGSSTSATTATVGSTTTIVRAATPQIAAAPWGLPSARDREVALADGATIWLLGGRDPGKSSRTSILQIDATTGAASPVGDLAVAVHDSAGARLGGRLVVFGGGSSSTVATVQAFTPGATTEVIGALPQPRSDLAAVTVAGRAYIVGGFDGTTFTPDVLETGDGVSFTVVAALPVPVRYPALAALGDKLYVFGGVLASGDESATGDSNAIQEVDLSTRSARVLARLPEPLSHSTALTLGGQVFVLGGKVAGATSPQAWRFDPAAGALVEVGTLPVAVSDSAAVVAGDVGYLLGGESEANVPVTSVATLRLG